MADSEKIVQTEISKSPSRRTFGLEIWRDNNGMDKSNQNNKMEYDGFMLCPVFPQDKIDWHKAQIIGPNEEELLTALYYDYSKWLEEVKIVCERGGIALEQYLRKGLGLAVKARRVRDCNYDTGLRLRGPERIGPDILLFFVKKCPHAREALLRGKLPLYPWRISQPIEKEQKPTETEADTTPAKGEKEKANLNINISGGIQAENVQIGNHASIHKEAKANEREKRKLWIIYWLLKKIPHWIYVLILFFAALLGIFSYLGWLGPIRTFINNILWPK